MERANARRTKNNNVRKELQEVITVRTFRDYVEESLLIVFSVVLALLLTTLFQKLHENKQTREVLTRNAAGERAA